MITSESWITDAEPSDVVTISIDTPSNTGLDIAIWTRPSCVTDTGFIFVTITMKTAFSWAISCYAKTKQVQTKPFNNICTVTYIFLKDITIKLIFAVIFIFFNLFYKETEN